MSSEPVVPSFDGLRLATMDDLPRIATVAAAGFFHSPTFQFQRGRYAEYPDDTLLSYWKDYHASILDPGCIVLVAEDKLVDAEGEKVYDALWGAAAYTPGAGPLGVEVVVGVASIIMKPDSCYKGRFQTKGHADGSALRTALLDLSRDQCKEANRIYSEATGPAKAKYLAGHMRLSTLAIHPAYWRRGHATRFISWCTRLADLEGCLLGISAVPMGATLAARAGFEERELVRVKRLCMHNETGRKDEPNVGDVELWIAIRQPSSCPVSDESATSSDSQL
ncbi:hypothetical protein K458DRAFT_413590 [Lentithecium fluviatile CBS 122367]|uniref:N-acetyltransferase domain-containing protein n=1 Tax=Lentithecium fluviatile CBS 122367 TaxID=1168545 RepID=A0A6G1JGM4_9PLEO|nr:hypothetical protein K458DRAFT_413590 [Lentithecium fluviatile CBS 122367]